MATGRTNRKWIQVFLDNSAGTLTEITAYCSSVGTLGLTYDTSDVTAYGDFVKNFTLGQPGAPIQLSGPFDTTLYALLIGYNTNGRQTSSNDALSFDVRIGIQHAWTTGEPTFGITGSATSGYQITSFTVDTAGLNWNATLEVVGSVAPNWSTQSHT
jgi:hypothetical protein